MLTSGLLVVKGTVPVLKSLYEKEQTIPFFVCKICLRYPSLEKYN